jgi:hypothetical protein
MEDSKVSDAHQMGVLARISMQVCMVIGKFIYSSPITARTPRTPPDSGHQRNNSHQINHLASGTLSA